MMKKTNLILMTCRQNSDEENCTWRAENKKETRTNKNPTIYISLKHKNNHDIREKMAQTYKKKIMDEFVYL